MIMFDAFNTPALDPVTMTEAEGVELIQSMLSQCPINVRAFPGREGTDNVTVFWTTTPTGAVGTVWEHVRHNAFNVPMTDGDRLVEAMRWGVEVESQFAADDAAYDGYSVGE